MEEFTSEARFQTLQWTRGKGYWGAHQHPVAFPFRDFRAHFVREPMEIIKSRYVSYLISWVLFHDKTPKAADISRTAGEEILGIVAGKMQEELTRLDDMKGAKQKGSTKRGKKR